MHSISRLLACFLLLLSLLLLCTPRLALLRHVSILGKSR